MKNENTLYYHTGDLYVAVLPSQPGEHVQIGVGPTMEAASKDLSDTPIRNGDFDDLREAIDWGLNHRRISHLFLFTVER